MIGSNSKNSYTGNGVTSVFQYTFKIFAASFVKVITKGPDVDDPEVTLVLNVDYTVSGVGNKTGGNITLPDPLEDGAKIFIIRDTPLTQDADIRNQGDYYPSYIEDALDKIVMMVQQINDGVQRSLQINISDEGVVSAYLPPASPSALLGFNEDADGLTVYPPGSFVGPEGPQGNPWFIGSGDPNTNPPAGPAPNAGDSYVNIDDMSIWQYDGATWTDTGESFPVSGVLIQGYSLRYGEEVDFSSAQAALEYIFNIGYTGPGVSLSSAGSGTLREKGASVVPGDLIAAVTKRTNDIASVLFYRAGVLIHTVPSPNPAGGNETYADSTPVTDTTIFRVDVRDVVDGGNGNTLAQSSVTYNYVYAYYSGVGAPGLSAAAVGGLNKEIINNTNNKNVVFVLTVGQVPYFAFPATYGDLTLIQDENGFDVTSSWTKKTGNITNVNGQTTSYSIYEYNSPAGVNNTTNYTFRR